MKTYNLTNGNFYSNLDRIFTDYWDELTELANDTDQLFLKVPGDDGYAIYIEGTIDIRDEDERMIIRVESYEAGSKKRVRLIEPLEFEYEY